MNRLKSEVIKGGDIIEKKSLPVPYIKKDENKGVEVERNYGRRNKWIPIERDIKKSRCADFGNEW
jgi:hypothetical protein